MTTTQNGGTGLTGLFSSMMGFTYASTAYTFRLIFTSPIELVDRVRVSLDNLSSALTDSMGESKSKHKVTSLGDELREGVENVYDSTRRVAENLAHSIRMGPDEDEILSGRKR